MVSASQPAIRAAGDERETSSRSFQGHQEQERQIKALLAEAQVVIDRLRHGVEAARDREARAEEEYATRVGEDEVVAGAVLSAAHALAGSIVGDARRDAEALLVAAEAKAAHIDREGQGVLRRVQAQVQRALVDCRSTERQQIQIALRDSGARTAGEPDLKPESDPEPEARAEPEYEIEPQPESAIPLTPEPASPPSSDAAPAPPSVLAATFKQQLAVAASRADTLAADEEWFAELRRAVGQKQSLAGDGGEGPDAQQTDGFRRATRS